MQNYNNDQDSVWVWVGAIVGIALGATILWFTPDVEAMGLFIHNFLY